jgi:hypothetical protein
MGRAHRRARPPWFDGFAPFGSQHAEPIEGRRWRFGRGRNRASDPTPRTGDGEGPRAPQQLGGADRDRGGGSVHLGLEHRARGRLCSRDRKRQRAVDESTFEVRTFDVDRTDVSHGPRGLRARSGPVGRSPLRANAAGYDGQRRSGPGFRRGAGRAGRTPTDGCATAVVRRESGRDVRQVDTVPRVEGAPSPRIGPSASIGNERVRLGILDRSRCFTKSPLRPAGRRKLGVVRRARRTRRSRHRSLRARAHGRTAVCRREAEVRR